MAKFKLYDVESKGTGIGVALSTMSKIRRPLKKVCDNHTHFPWEIAAREEARNEFRLRERIFLELMEMRFGVKPEYRLGSKCVYPSNKEYDELFWKVHREKREIDREWGFGDNVITIWGTTRWCNDELLEDTEEILYNGEKIGEIVLHVTIERT